MTARPAPGVGRDTEFFWEGVKGVVLQAQRCSGCATLRHPPKPMCPSCNSLEWEAEALSGRGTVHSYVIPHHPKMPGFEEPYVVVLVDLEEGVRIVSNLVGIDPSEVRNDMPVEVFFETFDGDVTLPQFRPATR